MMMVLSPCSYVSTTISFTGPVISSKQLAHDSVQLSDECWEVELEEEPWCKRRREDRFKFPSPLLDCFLAAELVQVALSLSHLATIPLKSLVALLQVLPF